MIQQLLLKRVLLLSTAILLGLSSMSFAQNAVKDTNPINDIMLQSFGWNEYDQSRMACGFYNFYNEQADYLSEAGYDMIWFPPPSQSTGGVGYIPTKLFNFSQTSWGTESELTTMLATYNGLGVYPIADVVVNHRGGTTDWMDFTEPTWDCSAVVSNDEASDPTKNPGTKPCGGNDTGEGFDGGRDLDHTNATVQAGVKQYLGKLNTLGFKGWRWDVAKGFSASYVGDYISASSTYYSVGEYWDGNTNTLKNWVDGTGKKSGVFDFSNYYTLSNAVKYNSYAGLNAGGRTPGLAGVIGYDNLAVTFVDNHDTFVKNEYIDDANVMKAYAYILTHPGIPCIWAAHYYGGTYSKDDNNVKVTRVYSDNQAAINKLMAVRKQNGINAYSSVDIKQAFGTYEAHISATYGTPAVVVLKLGSDLSAPAGDWIENTSGTGYKVWSKKQISVPTKPVGCSLGISLIGEGISDWNTDVALTSTDGVNFTLKDYTFAGGGVKFRANNSWSLNWGGTDFPSGTGVKGGQNNIIVLAGKYTVSFNVNTGVYSFSSGCTCPEVIAPVCANGVQYNNSCLADCAGATGYVNGACGVTVGIIGTAVNGWDEDVDMVSQGGDAYTLTYWLKAGDLKFRKDNKWTENWGSTAYPGGTGLLNGQNIPIPSEGNYTIEFNSATGVYNFEYLTVANYDYNPNNISVKVFPNPTSDIWNISSEEEITSVEVVDVSGKIVGNYVPEADSVQIKSSALGSGLYFAVVKTSSSVQTIKLFKK
ncbi:MAG: T9SS type A sorting domain-containing protein [Flavobacteriales bacterium]|nr:T9SS type A sorting domain-containing protein [Flavobacteriales bacterium]